MPEIDSELVRLLMRTGYLAAWNGFYKEAVTVFRGVQAVRPESEVPIIAAAVVAMLTGHHDVAVSSLQHGAIPLNPGCDVVRAHLGCAFRLQGREEEGMALLREISETSNQPEARDMAASLLGLPREKLLPSRSLL